MLMGNLLPIRKTRILKYDQVIKMALFRLAKTEYPFVLIVITY